MNAARLTDEAIAFEGLGVNRQSRIAADYSAGRISPPTSAAASEGPGPTH